jgi:hypothetical protein
MACGAAEKAPVVTPLDGTVKPTMLVLLPVALANVPGANALEVAARTNAVADLLLQRTDLPLLGPWDFSLQQPVDQARVLSLDTDAFVRARDAGLDLRQALVLHILVTENRATNVRDIQDVRQKDPKTGQFKTFRQHGVQSTVRVELSALEPMRGGRLGSVVVEQDDDPTDFEAGGDPRPGITSAIHKALMTFLQNSATGLRGGKRLTRGDGLVDSVPALQGWHAADLPSWNQLHQAEAAELREAAAFGLWDRFAPNVGMREIRDATRHQGVLVRKAMAPLQPGDVVMAVQGKPVLARYQVDRVMQTCAGQACAVTVARDGQKLDLQATWPTLPAVAVP